MRTFLFLNWLPLHLRYSSLYKSFLFHVVNVLDEDLLVLELVTFALEIQFVVQIFLNFFLLSVFLQQSSQNTLPAHPKHLRWHSSFLGSLSFTQTHMPTQFLGLPPALLSEGGSAFIWLLNEKSVSNHLANVLSGVSHCNFIDFIGVKPNFSFSTF